MLGYPSKEIKKLKANTKELRLRKLMNQEIVGLYMIGEISYHQLLNVLDISKEEGQELLKGLSLTLSQNVLRDDSELNVDVWKE